jgi:hypothetical protein
MEYFAVFHCSILRPPGPAVPGTVGMRAVALGPNGSPAFPRTSGEVGRHVHRLVGPLWAELGER